MKTTVKFLLAIAILFSAANVLMAQQTDKELKKDVSSRAIRSARVEAKKYKRAGYYVAPGALLLDKQLERAWLRQYETNDKNEAKYIMATGNSVAESQTAGKLQAMETAKLEIAGQINTQIAALIENSIANQQLNNEEAASVTKTVAASKNLIAQEIGQVLPMVEMYKKIGKNIEVNVRLAYNMATAFDVAKKVIRKSLEEETKIAHEKLEGLMKF
ncbi:MAG TPA: hypothetical protein VFC67_26580 [Prolixibacteraceae bacterium]|nr:hypothetical protein [Prolixibacteraceae bacterium]